MSALFGLVEPLSTADLISNYWHFLRSISEEERQSLGSIEVFLATGAVLRGWPVSLKNHTLCISTSAPILENTSVAFIELSQISAIAFNQAHRVVRFITAGAMSRSPLQAKPTPDEAKKYLHKICEAVRKSWRAKIFFESDPSQLPIDELLNLNEVMEAFWRALGNLSENAAVWGALSEIKALHVVNSDDHPEFSISLRHDDEIELSFRFSRALPTNVDELVLTLLTGIF